MALPNLFLILLHRPAPGPKHKRPTAFWKISGQNNKTYITYLSTHPPQPKKHNKPNPPKHHLLQGSFRILLSSPPNTPQGIPNDPTSTTFNLKVSPGESGTLRAQQNPGRLAPPCCFKTHGRGRSYKFLLIIEFVGVLLLKHLFLNWVISFREFALFAVQQSTYVSCNVLLTGASWHYPCETASGTMPTSHDQSIVKICSLCFDASTHDSVALFHFFLPPHLFPAESPNPKTTTKRKKHKSPIRPAQS